MIFFQNKSETQHLSISLGFGAVDHHQGNALEPLNPTYLLNSNVE